MAYRWQPSECGALPIREALAFRRDALRRAKALRRGLNRQGRAGAA